MTIDLVASHFTLTGGGFGEPPRYGFAERCQAAAEAGFRGIGLQIADYETMLADGITDGDLTAILTEHGLRVVELEFLAGWVFDNGDVRAPGEPSARERTAYAIADRFGAHHLTSGEFGSFPALDVEASGRRLRGCADRAAAHGLRLAVEPFPWSVLRDYRVAADVVDGAGAFNAGLMLDVWHFFNTGSTVEDIGALAANDVVAVQLNDGTRVWDNFLWHARNERRLPGEGDMDVVGLIRALDRIGFDGPYCVEVNYPQLRDLPAQEAATLAYQTSQEVIRLARTSSSTAVT